MGQRSDLEEDQLQLPRQQLLRPPLLQLLLTEVVVVAGEVRVDRPSIFEVTCYLRCLRSPSVRSFRDADLLLGRVLDGDSVAVVAAVAALDLIVAEGRRSWERGRSEGGKDFAPAWLSLLGDGVEDPWLVAHQVRRKPGGGGGEQPELVIVQGGRG